LSLASIRTVPLPRETTLREDALLYLSWVRGAVGRFAPGENDVTPGPDDGTTPPAVEAAPPEGVLGTDPREGPVRADPSDAFGALRQEALSCRRCRLCESRTTVVFGEGSRRPRLMVVGEAPGADEDATGRPFVGKAGQLLTRMLAAIGLSRDDVFIANVLKCRPPGNRPPQPDEVASCRPYLLEQMRLLDPALVLVLGNHAARAVLATDRGITSLRGAVATSPEGRAVLPTFHPAYLLRNPAAKREAWLDLQLAARLLGPPP